MKINHLKGQLDSKHWINEFINIQVAGESKLSLLPLHSILYNLFPLSHPIRILNQLIVSCAVISCSNKRLTCFFRGVQFVLLPVHLSGLKAAQYQIIQNSKCCKDNDKC